MDEQAVGLLLRVEHLERSSPSPVIDAGVADLAAGLGIERRLVDDDLRPPRRLAASVDLRAVLDQRQDRRPPPARCRSRGTRSRRCCSRTANQTVSVAASPEPAQLRARLGLLPLHRRVKPAMSTRDAALAQRILRQVEREAVGVVELEGGLAVEHVALRRASRSPRRAATGRAPASCGSGVSSSFSVSAISASAAHQFRIGLAHLAHQRRHQPPHQRLARRRAAAHGAWRGA